MNIKTIGENLTQLTNKISDEKGFGEAAKNEMILSCNALESIVIECFDEAKANAVSAIIAFRNGVVAHFNDRTVALDALLDEPVQALEEKKAA